MKKTKKKVLKHLEDIIVRGKLVSNKRHLNAVGGEIVKPSFSKTLPDYSD